MNRKDRYGKNVFEGGFLGLDNIGVFDRSAPLPTGGYLEQADGTAWMALFSQNMVEIAIELAAHDPIYEDMVYKFAEHFLYIAAAMNRPGDGRDVGRGGRLLLRRAAAARRQRHAAQGALAGRAAAALRHDGDRAVAARAHSAGDWPRCMARLQQMPELLASHPPHRPGAPGRGRARASWRWSTRSGCAASSRACSTRTSSSAPTASARSRGSTREHPYILHVDGQEYRVDYLPAESNSGMFGGNSNWRGPIWFPVNALIIRALQQFYLYYGDGFKVECPTGSGDDDEPVRGVARRSRTG